MLATIAILILPLTILFHVDPGLGILSGFLHPILGLDHLLAMVTVGLLSAQIGGRAIWTVPVAFVALMALGGILGLVGIPLPGVELGIAISVILLGVALLISRNFPLAAMMIIIGLFGLLHGHAHGVEVPSLTDGFLLIFAYVVGFLVATAGLHLVGALIGMIAVRSEQGKLILRGSGLIIAIIGVFIFTALI